MDRSGDREVAGPIQSGSLRPTEVCAKPGCRKILFGRTRQIDRESGEENTPRGAHSEQLKRSNGRPARGYHVVSACQGTFGANDWKRRRSGGDPVDASANSSRSKPMVWGVVGDDCRLIMRLCGAVHRGRCSVAMIPRGGVALGDVTRCLETLWLGDFVILRLGDSVLGHTVCCRSVFCHTVFCDTVFGDTVPWNEVAPTVHAPLGLEAPWETGC